MWEMVSLVQIYTLHREPRFPPGNVGIESRAAIALSCTGNCAPWQMAMLVVVPLAPKAGPAHHRQVWIALSEAMEMVFFVLIC